MWGPLTIELLGPEGKLALPLMVTSLSAAQSVGASLIGKLAEAHGVADALLPFVALAGAANAVTTVCLREVLRAASARRAEAQTILEPNVTDGVDECSVRTTLEDAASEDIVRITSTALTPASLCRSDDVCFAVAERSNQAGVRRVYET